MSFCTTCGEWAYSLHTCPPRWLVWCPEDGETADEGARTLYARGPREAAEEWARRDDCESADYRIVRGEAVEVHVLGIDRAGPIARFKVLGESVPNYSAIEISAASASTLPPPTEPSPRWHESEGGA